MEPNTWQSALIDRDLSYIRKVYAWLLVGILLCSGASWAVLNIGPTETVTLETGLPPMEVPSLLAGVLAHPYLLLVALFGLLLMTLMARVFAGTALAGVTYLGFTSVSGLLVAPTLFFAQYKAAHYTTLSANPIRDAFFLTLAAFVGMTLYAWTTKRDFSFLGGFLFTGLSVVIVAMIMAIVFHSHVLEMAVDSVSVLVFSGYILYDTQLVLDKSDRDDAISDALNLFLDVLNIFISLVRILSSSKDD
jgi:modulator of FtsH protease